MELYVHIPFCVKKCRYCSFASFSASESEQEAYTALLLKEASARLAEAEEPIRTVYIGGGTPSLLPPAVFRRLADGLRCIFGFDSVTEFTSEANPGTVTGEWLSAAVDSGVNRLSFGMQACQDRLLCMLGRIHRFSDVSESVRLARASGIGNISIDLMFGIPGQTSRDWKETLRAALSLCPEHISAYGLIPEEGTPLFEDLRNGRLTPPDPDEERAMYGDAVSILGAHGFCRYEISNFAKDGYECRHNIGYWTQVPYIGLGLSAASMISVRTGPDGMSCVRSTNPSDPEAYSRLVDSDRASLPAEVIGPRESRFETMMLGLRMNAGVSSKSFRSLHGIALEECYGSRLEELVRRGLLCCEDGCWRLTERGFDIQNSVLVELMD